MEIGKELGNWKCSRILGRGNFGVVSLWINKLNPQERRAIKYFEVNGTAAVWDDSMLSEVEKRWRMEVDLLCNQVESPHIVSPLPIPEDLKQLSPRLPLLSLEYCSGGDLRQILRKPENVAGLTEFEVRKVLKCIGEAVKYLHSINIIHRDLKPENILLTAPNENGTYKLSDLGFARDLAHSDSLCSTVVGTLQYLSPEVFLGRMYDRTVDFWSLGIIAFEISCGFRPFLHGKSPAEWIPHVEKKNSDTIAICQVKNGSCVSSNRFPFNTYLSERFRKCLEMWLGMVLQFDPAKRGRRFQHPNSSGEIVAIQVLGTILEMEMLDVYCPARRLSFAIGRSTKMSDVCGWIQRDIGIITEDQLLIGSNGLLPGNSESPLEAKRNGVTLFMIPKNLDVESSLKLPKCLSAFLQDSETMEDIILVRRIWASIVHFLRVEEMQLTMLEKSLSSYRKYLDATSSKLAELMPIVQKYLGFLEILSTLEKRIGSVENLFEISGEFSEGSNKEEYIRQMEGAMREILKNEIVKSCDDTLSSSEKDDFHKIYLDILEMFDVWRKGSFNAVSSLVEKLCYFIALRDYIWRNEYATLASTLETTKRIIHKVSGIEGILKEIDHLKNEVVDTHCAKQYHLLSYKFKEKEKNETGSLKSLMTQSIELEIETEEKLTSAMKEAEDVKKLTEKLNWNFLEKDAKLELEETSS